MWISVATGATIATMTADSVSRRNAQSRRKPPMSNQVPSTTGPGCGSSNSTSASDTSAHRAESSMQPMVTVKANRSPKRRPNAPASRQPASGARTAVA